GLGIDEVLSKRHDVRSGGSLAHVRKQKRECQRKLGRVDLPGDTRLVQLVEDRPLRELAWDRRQVVVADVAEGGPREQVQPVGKRLRWRRGEVLIAHCERAVQSVVQRYV